tara:strand:- start:1910 stop:2623 length:714 start_codon:yes stop_codon:yes gene_type:complete
MKNKYVFILTVSVFCSLLLSLASQGLKPLKDKNVEIDKKKNILNAVGLNTVDLSNADIDDYFSLNIDTLIIDLEGNVNKNLFVVDLESKENNQSGEVKYYNNSEEFLPLYIDNSKNAIVLPISGKGLWSTLFGYFAIDSNNYSTVKGITFYKHKETPGLGGEVSKNWFQENFIGKEIYKDNTLNSVKVAKAGYADKENLYEVDGISGATITSNGVSDFLKRDLKRYEKYFMRRLNEQ